MAYNTNVISIALQCHKTFCGVTVLYFSHFRIMAKRYHKNVVCLHEVGLGRGVGVGGGGQVGVRKTLTNFISNAMAISARCRCCINKEVPPRMLNFEI